MALALVVNGQDRLIAELGPAASLLEVLANMGFKADRIAIEHNGTIAPRGLWPEISVSSGDRLEIVHFVGGGLGARQGRFHGSSVGRKL